MKTVIIALRRNKNSLPIVSLVLLINVFLLYLLYGVRRISGVNTYFIVFHVFGMLLLSFLYLYLFILENRKENLSYYKPGNLLMKIAFLGALISLGYLATFTLGVLPYGSLIMIFVVSFISGAIAFVLWGKKSKLSKQGYFGHTLADLKTFELKMTSNTYWLLLIFLVGFFLRFAVFGLPTVPPGYDIPQYLLLAAKASKVPFPELLRQGFSFTGNIYQDTISFAGLWLGGLGKILHIFGLGSIIIAKIVMPLISSCFIIMIYFLARLFVNERAALFSSLFLAISPIELLYGGLYKEMLGGLILIIALYFFLKNIKRRSLITLSLFLIFLFFLFKVSITAFTKLAVFLLAYSVYLALSGKFKKIELIGGAAAVFSLTSLLLAQSNSAGESLIGFRLFRIISIDPYTYYSFPILILTSLTIALITFFYFFKSFVARTKDEERSLVSFSFSIFLSIAIISFFITALAGYHVFPSSNQLYALRLCLYLDIPFALIAGLFLFKVTREVNFGKIGVATAVIALAFLDFFLTFSAWTTVHRSTLNTFIEEKAYKSIESLSSSDRVICYGDFTWHPRTGDFAFGNWLKYLIYSRTGKEPIMIESLDELENVNFQAGETYLLLDCVNQRIREKTVIKL